MHPKRKQIWERQMVCKLCPNELGHACNAARINNKKNEDRTKLLLNLQHEHLLMFYCSGSLSKEGEEM